MNLNDFRKNAYASSTGFGKKNDGFSMVGNPADSQNSSKKNKAKQANSKNSSINNGNNGTPAGTPPKDEGLLKVGKTTSEPDSVYRRVAKFLLLIGVDEASKIIPHLPEEQTEKIIPELASVRSIDDDEAAEIFEEFQALLTQAKESGGIGTAREILQKAYGEQKAEELIEAAVPYPNGKPFEFLAEASAERILQLLSDESDEVATLVLSMLEPKLAASVINIMDEARKSNIVLRLAKMKPVLPEVIRRVDKAMHEKSLKQVAVTGNNIDGRNALAEILRRMPEKSESEILSALSYRDRELSEDLRSRLFTIEDVQNADDRFIQEKLREMNEDDIARLIAAKSDEFRFKILKNVSRGRGDIILEQEQLLKPMRRSDCEAVTNEFFSALRKAYEEGKLRIAGRDEDMFVD